MRRSSALLGALAAALALVVIPAAPAQAARSITATVPSGVGCPNGQIMTGAKFTLTKVSQGQKISVQTRISALTRDHNSFASGTASYDVTFDAPLQSPSGPATATVADNWSGTFQLTAAACRTPTPAGITLMGSTCGTNPQLSVRLNNTNAIMVAYSVSGSSLSGQTRQVLSGRTEEVVFNGVTRGRSYTVNANGDDGTRSAATVVVPACAPPTTERPDPTTPVPTSESASPSSSPSASSSASPSPSPSVSSSEASVEPYSEPTVESVVDPPTPTPMAEKSSFASSKATWFGVLAVLLGILALIGMVTVRLMRRHSSGT